MNITKKYVDELSYLVIGAAIEVHKTLGLGLLESIYHKCMLEELKYKKLDVVSEQKVIIDYKGVRLGADLKCDIVVEKLLAIEMKAIEELLPIHDAQLLSYMRLLRLPKGILLNFCVTNIFKQGQKTFVNDIYADLD